MVMLSWIDMFKKYRQCGTRRASFNDPLKIYCLTPSEGSGEYVTVLKESAGRHVVRAPLVVDVTAESKSFSVAGNI